MARLLEGFSKGLEVTIVLSRLRSSRFLRSRPNDGESDTHDDGSMRGITSTPLVVIKFKLHPH